MWPKSFKANPAFFHINKPTPFLLGQKMIHDLRAATLQQEFMKVIDNESFCYIFHDINETLYCAKKGESCTKCL